MALLSLCLGWGSPRGRPRGQASPRHLGASELCYLPAEVTPTCPRVGGPWESPGTMGCGSPGEAPGRLGLVPGLCPKSCCLSEVPLTHSQI